MVIKQKAVPDLVGEFRQLFSFELIAAGIIEEIRALTRQFSKRDCDTAVWCIDNCWRDSFTPAIEMVLNRPC